jgi:hypothetical protein
MNREFMEFMCHRYPDVVKCSFSKDPHTILSEKDNAEEKVEEAPRMALNYESGREIVDDLYWKPAKRT